MRSLPSRSAMVRAMRRMRSWLRPQRQRNGERIEAQGYSEQQYGEQVHRGKKFAQKYEELFVFGVPSY